MGLTLRNTGRYEEALHYFNRVIEINPYEFRALGNIGIINKKQKKYSEAITAYEGILDIKPNDEGAIVNLANIYFRLKEYDQCNKYILLFKNKLKDHLFIISSQRDKARIKKALERFEVYSTVIEKEMSKSEN